VPANADQKQPADPNLSCELKLPGGNTIHYPPGTKITVKMGDGSKPDTYVCDGKTGKWKQAGRVTATSSGSDYLSSRNVLTIAPPR
jgi:hypothetical protein